MSIASEITRLQNAKAAIKAAIEAKGVTVLSNATLDDFDDYISQIETDDTTLKSLIDKSITSIDIPTDINSIGPGVFRGCTRLNEITIPNNINSIGVTAFYGCSNLESVVLPQGLTFIPDNCFYNCSKLVNINVPSTVTSISINCFFGCAFTTIELSSSIISIENKVFFNCVNLTSVYIYATTPPTLGTNVFNNNASGRKIYVPAESVNAYKTATNWSAYANDIEAIPTNS